MWSTMCPAELVGDREAGQQAMCLHGLLRPALRGGGELWPSPSLSVRNTNTLWLVMTWNLLSLLLRVISMAVRGITPLGKGSWRDSPMTHRDRNSVRCADAGGQQQFIIRLALNPQAVRYSCSHGYFGC